jgi:hypothetical protein
MVSFVSRYALVNIYDMGAMSLYDMVILAIFPIHMVSESPLPDYHIVLSYGKLPYGKHRPYGNQIVTISYHTQGNPNFNVVLNLKLSLIKPLH